MTRGALDRRQGRRFDLRQVRGRAAPKLGRQDSTVATVEAGVARVRGDERRDLLRRGSHENHSSFLREKSASPGHPAGDAGSLGRVERLVAWKTTRAVFWSARGSWDREESIGVERAGGKREGVVFGGLGGLETRGSRIWEGRRVWNSRGSRFGEGAGSAGGSWRRADVPGVTLRC